MGEGGKDALRVVFDPGLKLEFHGAKVTSDGGLIPYRELDEAFGLTDRTENILWDRRTGKNTQHTMTALLRQSVFSRLAGYEDTNDAERLSVDPAMRHVIGGRAREKQAASTSQMGRFETEVRAARCQPRRSPPISRPTPPGRFGSGSAALSAGCAAGALRPSLTGLSAHSSRGWILGGTSTNPGHDLLGRSATAVLLAARAGHWRGHWPHAYIRRFPDCGHGSGRRADEIATCVRAFLSARQPVDLAARRARADSGTQAAAPRRVWPSGLAS